VVIPTLVAGDIGTTLVVTCIDEATQLPLDLTDATAKLRFDIANGTVIERTATVLSPTASGKVQYRFASGDLTKGRLRGEIRISKSGIVLTQSDLFFINIRAPLA
jgi:hypothetical protein